MVVCCGIQDMTSNEVAWHRRLRSYQLRNELNDESRYMVRFYRAWQKARVEVFDGCAKHRQAEEIRVLFDTLSS